MQEDLKENKVWQKLRVCSSVSKSQECKTPFGNMNIKMSWSDNMIWVCPVFDDYDRAVEYMNWDKEEVREMTITYVKKSEK